MKTLHHSSLLVALCGLALGILAGSTWAQESQQTTQQDQQSQGQQNQGQTPEGQQNEAQPTAPIPAYHSPLASEADNDDTDEEGTQSLTPDTRALAGAQNLTLGNLANDHSYWQPHIDIAGSVDSNPQVTPNGSGWGTWTSFAGGVDVHRTSGNSDMTVNYLGGAAISTDGGANNGIVQQLGFVDSFTLRRWTLSFIDQMGYLPGSSYGFGGLGGIESSTGGSAGLGTTFGPPQQTTLTGTGQSFTNAFNTEADIHVTPRTSLTFAGGYSLLHYFDNASDLLNSTDAIFRGGYNYLVTRKDTIAVFYTYTAYRYSNFDQSINDHTIQASYARRVTGRLAFQIAAGPQIALSRIPITTASGSSGSETGSGTSTNSSTQLYWSLNMNLQYQLRRAALGLSYYHGVSAGSGVLGGAVTDTVTGSATRQMSRTFSSQVTAGYARNNGLAISSTATPTSQTYSYWFTGATFSHPIGRTLALTLSYQLQYQDSSGSFCTGPTCGTNLLRNVISFGIGWHERPLLF
jgi:hypothetical protein